MSTLPTTESRRFVADYFYDHDGLYYSVDGGELRGPFRDEMERENDLVDVIRRWRTRAQALGGSVVRLTRETWVVTVPKGTAIEGGQVVHGRAWAGVHRAA